MSAPLARREDLGDRLVVVAANPARRNALSPEYYDVLTRALDTAAREPRVGSVILVGEGNYFCAGGDLRLLAARRELPEAERRERVEALHDVVRAIGDCPVPVVAAVEGGAAGAGVSIAFACDLVVAGKGARFTIAYVNAGLVPDGGLTATLSRHLPRATLMRLALLGEPVTAARLFELGALSALAPDGAALDEAHALADRFAAGPRDARRRIKALVRSAGDASVAAQLDAERDAMADAIAGDEAAEGIAAFTGKRAADFRAPRAGRGMNGDEPTRVHELVARQAARRPGAVALIDDAAGLRLSWAGYAAAVDELEALLRSRGVAAGDRVLLVAENCAATAAAIFAASRVGAAAVPVNARMTAAELARVSEHAAPALTLYTGHVSEDAAAHARAAGAEDVGTGVGTLGAAVGGVAGGIDSPDVGTGIGAGPDAAAVILYTTGTTGAPKGVMLTHANLLFAARASAALRGLSEADTIYGVLPMTHVFGVASVLMASAHAGSTVRLAARFVPERLHAALTSGVTVFPAVPQMHALLMQHVAERGLDRLEGGALRYVSSGAAPLDPAWKRKAEGFYGLALQNGYGMTESTAGVCGTTNPIGSDDTSAGAPFPGIEVRLDRSVGSSADASDAEVGEILTRGPHVMSGYFRRPDETARAIDAHGWLRTGDLGRIDARGRVHVVGRCKELIIRGGFNVYPPEVEAALNEHPRVVQAAVVGRALPGGDEEILAFVQCADPASMDEAEVRAFVGERLASYKRPARVVFATALPAAATGKVLKHRLIGAFPRELGDAL